MGNSARDLGAGPWSMSLSDGANFSFLLTKMVDKTREHVTLMSIVLAQARLWLHKIVIDTEE